MSWIIFCTSPTGSSCRASQQRGESEDGLCGVVPSLPSCSHLQRVYAMASVQDEDEAGAKLASQGLERMCFLHCCSALSWATFAAIGKLNVGTSPDDKRDLMRRHIEVCLQLISCPARVYVLMETGAVLGQKLGIGTKFFWGPAGAYCWGLRAYVGVFGLYVCRFLGPTLGPEGRILRLLRSPNLGSRGASRPILGQPPGVHGASPFAGVE